MKLLLIGLIVPCALIAQHSPHPFFPRDESTECVPPEMISQLYFTYSCTILSVNDDLTLNVELEDTYNKKSRTVTITLAGLTFDDFSSAEKQKTKDAILLLTMGRRLTACSSVDHDPQNHNPLYHIELNDAENTITSINFSLLREGLALYRKRGYDTDSYLDCQFQKAQTEAQKESLGHWQMTSMPANEECASAMSSVQ